MHGGWLRKSACLNNFGVSKININWWLQWFGALVTAWCFTSDRHSCYHQTWFFSSLWLLMIISAMEMLRIAIFSSDVAGCISWKISTFVKIRLFNNIFWLFLPHITTCSAVNCYSTRQKMLNFWKLVTERLWVFSLNLRKLSLFERPERRIKLQIYR